MIEKIQHATASSPEGAKGLVKGVLACAFQNMAFMLPTGLLYLLVKDLLAGSTSGRSTFYLLGCVACFALILLYRKDRLRRSLELKRARTEAGTTSRRMLV